MSKIRSGVYMSLASPYTVIFKNYCHADELETKMNYESLTQEDDLALEELSLNGKLDSTEVVSKV